MTRPAEPRPEEDTQHLMEWDPRLWDWVDGMAEPSRKAAVEQHLEYCGCCQQRLLTLQELNRRLSVALPRLSLEEDFDQKVLSQLPWPD
jgi:anti-sigma factor RsiW